MAREWSSIFLRVSSAVLQSLSKMARGKSRSDNVHKRSNTLTNPQATGCPLLYAPCWALLVFRRPKLPSTLRRSCHMSCLLYFSTSLWGYWLSRRRPALSEWRSGQSSHCWHCVQRFPWIWCQCPATAGKNTTLIWQ